MSCSPSNLYVDVALWLVPEIFDDFKKSFQNLSDGDTYDCGLKSVPCESNLVSALTSSNPTLAYWFDLIVVYILLTLVIVIGIVGNTSNIIIFSTNDIATNSSNNLLLWLSVSDQMSLLSIGAVITGCFLCFFDDSTALTASNILLLHMSIISRSFTLLSLDLVTVISMQRAVAVVLPFKLSTVFSNKNTNMIITALLLLCVIMMIGFHLCFVTKWIYHPYFRKQISLGHQPVFSDLKTTIYFSSNYFVYRIVINLVLIFITGSLTVYKLKERIKNRSVFKTSTSTSLETADAPKKMSTRETKAIKMSLTVCFITFIMCSVAITVNVLNQIYGTELFRSPLSGSAEFGLMLIVSINSSFNFFLYLKMSHKYRAIIGNCITCTGNHIKNDNSQLF